MLITFMDFMRFHNFKQGKLKERNIPDNSSGCLLFKKKKKIYNIRSTV